MIDLFSQVPWIKLGKNLTLRKIAPSSNHRIRRDLKCRHLALRSFIDKEIVNERESMAEVETFTRIYRKTGSTTHLFYSCSNSHFQSYPLSF